MEGRMTRKKAAEVAEQLHIDEDDLLQLPSMDVAGVKAKTKAGTPEPVDRAPLGELTPNSPEGKSRAEDGGLELKRSVRGGKRPRKIAQKANKVIFDASVNTGSVEEPQNVIADDNVSTPPPASDGSAEDSLKDVPEVSISQALEDLQPKSPQSASVVLTRSQLKEKKASVDTEPKSPVDGIGQAPREQLKTMNEEIMQDVQAGSSAGAMTQLDNDDLASPPPSAIPKIISHLRGDTPSKRSTSNKENVEPDTVASSQPMHYDILESAAIPATTPPGSSRPAPSRPENHIAALDELDDAVENVNRDIPDVETSPEKPKTNKEAEDSPTKKRKAAPVVRTTKASQARISLAQTAKEGTESKPPSLGRPRPSVALGRSSSVRQSSALKSSPAGRRVTSTNQDKEEKTSDGEKKEVVIPHSKPRPVSLSFPTPPPPAKSTKAPTQSTFKLPGEAVAEKLRAAREARMAKATEEEKKQPFKARPVPAGLSKAPSVRQTTASRARESIMNGTDLKASTSIAADLKRANSVATSRPTALNARLIAREATRPATNGTKAGEDPLSVKKRASTAMANTSKPRASLATSIGPPSTSAAPRISSLQSNGTSKGKEVFNRHAAAKAAAEKEKSDKETAAKKARADAAEKSRQMSREWAEKQKKKKHLAAKQTTQKIEDQTNGNSEAAAVEPTSVAEPIVLTG